MKRTDEDEIRETERNMDRIKGSLFGGAVGDALGYAVEFLGEEQIQELFGKGGIQEYLLDPTSGKALISDDTQMSLFTANGILVGETRGRMRGIQGPLRSYVAIAYQDWLKTQEGAYFGTSKRGQNSRSATWLMDIPELYSQRAPGRTCISELVKLQDNNYCSSDYVSEKRNNSKGCGGVMRVAPLGLHYNNIDLNTLDMEGAQLAAITHSHPLGYMPAAILVHIVNRAVYAPEMPLAEIVAEARDTATDIFKDEDYINDLDDLVNLAIDLSENEDSDINNIHMLGEGWTAEETLAIAIYCSLKYQNDFSAGIIASVNHRGDSDSTGAVTGNILGAVNGYSAIDEKWKTDLELADIIIEMAEDLCHGCQMSEYGRYRDIRWIKKYIEGVYPKKV